MKITSKIERIIAIFITVVIMLDNIIPSFANLGIGKAIAVENEEFTISDVKFQRSLENDNWQDFQEGEELPDGTEVLLYFKWHLNNNPSKLDWNVDLNPIGVNFKVLDGLELTDDNNIPVGVLNITEEGVAEINCYKSYVDQYGEVNGTVRIRGVLHVDDEKDGLPAENEKISISLDSTGPHTVTITYPNAVGDISVNKTSNDTSWNRNYDVGTHVITYTVTLKAENGYLENIDLEETFDNTQMDYYETTDEGNPIFYTYDEDGNEIEYNGFSELQDAIVNSKTGNTASLARDQEFTYYYKMKITDSFYDDVKGSEEIENKLKVNATNRDTNITGYGSDTFILRRPKVKKSAVTTTTKDITETTWKIKIDMGDYPWDYVDDTPFSDTYTETKTNGGQVISTNNITNINKDLFNEQSNNSYVYQYTIPLSNEAIDISKTEPINVSNTISDIYINNEEFDSNASIIGTPSDYLVLEKKCIESESEDEEVSWEVTFSGVSDFTGLKFSDTLTNGAFVDDTYSTYININGVNAIYLHDNIAEVTEDGKSIIKPSTSFDWYTWTEIETWDNVVGLNKDWDIEYYNQLSFNFTDTFISENSDIILKYKTKKIIPPAQSHIVYTNTANVTGNNLTLQDTATYEEDKLEFVKKEMISSSNNYSLKGNTFAYKLDVDVRSLIDLNKIKVGDTITLIDNLDSSLVFDKVQGVYSYSEENYWAVKPDSILGKDIGFNGDIRDNEERFKVIDNTGDNGKKDNTIEFKIKFDQEMIDYLKIENVENYGASYTTHFKLEIEYTAKASNDYEFSAKADANNQVNLTNSVIGTLDDGTNIGKDIVSENVRPAEVLIKTMKFDETTMPKANFYIDVPSGANGNPTGDRLILNDVMGSSYYLYDNSIKVELLDEYGNVIENSELTRADDKEPEDLTENEYSIKYQSLNNEIIFNVPDEKLLRISYTVNTTLEKGDTATFETMGNTVTEPNSGASATNESAVKSIGTISYEAIATVQGVKGKITLLKYYVDAAGNRVRVSDTKFKVYSTKYENGNIVIDEFIKEIVLEGGESEQVFDDIKYDHIYALIEEKTDNRLKVNDKITYFAIKGSDWDTVQGKDTIEIKTIVDTDYLRYENEKKDTEVTISKVNKKDESKKIGGAVLQILDKNNKLVEEWTTVEGEDHVIKNKLVIGDEYRLHEKSAPAGYISSKDIKFTVTFDDVDSTGTVYKKALTMKDDTTKVKFKKTDIVTGAEIEGAKLELYDSKGKLVDSWTTKKDESYELDGKLVAGETYKLVEKKSPKGYAIAEEKTFTVNSDGTLQTVEMQDDTTKVKFKKTDLVTGKEIEGAELELYDSKGTLVDSWTTKKDQSYELDGELIAGETYKLVEKTAPDGYIVAEEVKFTVNLDGKVQTVEMKDDTTKVTIKKTDMVTGEEIADAKLELYDSEGTLVDSWTTKAGESYELNGKLKAGETYRLVEKTAPDGYFKAEEVTFTVGTDGTLQTVEMKDKPTVVSVSKVDVADGKELEGAKLQILTKNETTGKYEVVEVNGKKVEWTSGEDGKDENGTIKSHTITGLKTETEYILREIIAPDGYSIATDTKFTIDSEGKVKVQGTEVENGLILVEDSVLHFNVNKVDAGNGEEIEGATIVIYEKDSDGNILKDTNGEKIIVDSWVSKAGETHDFGDKLKAGHDYVLAETVAPTGYGKVTTELGFKVNNDGTITTKTTELKETQDSNGNTVYLVEDNAIKFNVNKVDAGNGEEIEGATLVVYEVNGETGDIAQDENGNDKIIDSWESKLGETHDFGDKLESGKIYILRETIAPSDYAKLETDIKVIVAEDGSIKADISCTVDENGNEVYLVENGKKDSIMFTKYGRYNEDFASNSNEMETIPSVEFALSKAETPDVVIETAVSDENGVVLFENMVPGKYIIKEVDSGYENYVKNDIVYYAEVALTGFAGLTYEDGTKVEENKVVNEVYRGVIEFTKVNESNPEQTLQNSTYGIYRKVNSYAINNVSFEASSVNALESLSPKASINNEEGVSGSIPQDAEFETIDGEEYVKIAEVTSDENGIVRFDGAITGVEYRIKENVAPAGYYVSENPITLKLEISEDSEVLMALSDNGSGTVTMDENGNITWLEPVVIAEFSKVDENGKLLAGAKLHIEDKDGNIVKDSNGSNVEWVSTDKVYKVEGVLVCGQKYKLVEDEAPVGYKLADPIEFTVEEKAGPDEVQSNLVKVTMVDKKEDVIEETENKTDDTNKDTEIKNDDIKKGTEQNIEDKKEEITVKETKTVQSVNTGDNIIQMIIILVASSICLVLAITVRRW